MIQPFRVFVPASTLGLLAFETVVIISAFAVSTYLLLGLDPTDYLLDDLGWLSVTLVSLSLLAGIYIQDLYSQTRVKSRLLLAQQLMIVTGITFLLQSLIAVLAPNLYFPFPVILLGCAISVVVIFIGRLLFSTYVIPRVAAERLLLIGDSPVLDNVVVYLQEHQQLGIQIAGHIREPGTRVKNASGTNSHLEEVIREFHANRIVVSAPDALLAVQLLDLRFLGFSVQDAAETYARVSNREALSGLNPQRLLYSKEFEPSARDLFFQRLASTVIATAVLFLLAPLILAIAVLIRLSSSRPVLERQTQSGHRGAPFTLYSFRVPTAGSGETVKPTVLGRILTRTGLYAFPQFWNVLRGDLSIVGPRPHRVEFAHKMAQHIPFYPHRTNKVHPGMTGLAQIEMRSYGPPPDSMVELEYDMYYLKNMSPMMDLFISVQSIKNILLGTDDPKRIHGPVRTLSGAAN